MEQENKDNKFYYLFKVSEDDKDSRGPFADSNNLLEDVVSFISIELYDKTRVYQWFSPNATLKQLFQFAYSKLYPDRANNTNLPRDYDFYFQDKEVKKDNKYIKYSEKDQSTLLREFLSPINQGSTRNRYLLKVIHI